MKASRGKANPAQVNELMKKLIGWFIRKLIDFML
jgi:hypothetical protein